MEQPLHNQSNREVAHAIPFRLLGDLASLKHQEDREVVRWDSMEWRLTHDDKFRICFVPSGDSHVCTVKILEHYLSAAFDDSGCMVFIEVPNHLTNLGVNLPVADVLQLAGKQPLEIYSTYEGGEVDIIYIGLRAKHAGSIATTHELEEESGFLVDLDNMGRVLGFEIMDAKTRLVRTTPKA